MNPFSRGAIVLGLSIVGATPLQGQPTIALPARDRPLAVRFTDVFSIGKEDGLPHEVFADVRQVAFDARENLYVLDVGNHRIVVYDRTGRFLRQIGRRGNGPNEFSSPSRIAVAADGSVVVADNGRRSFSMFNPQGVFLRSVPYDSRYGMSGQGLAPHPAGGVITGAQPLPVGSYRRVHWLLRYNLAASRGAVTALAELPDAVADNPEQSSQSGTTQVITSSRPTFAPSLRWTSLPAGAMAVTTTASYSVRVLDPAGRTLRVLQRPIAPRAVTERDRTLAAERRRASGRSITVVGGGSNLPPEVQRLVDQALGSMEFASTIPVIERIGADARGRLWIQRAGSQPGRRGPVDLITQEGRYLGSMASGALPDAFSPAGRAAFIVTDEMEVERVVVRSVSGVPN